MDHVASPYAALVARLAQDPTTPLVTDVDLATGDRVELSVGSAVNGAAKAAHLVGGLTAELGRPPRIALRLPPHWQALTFTLGAWAAGGVLLTGDTGTSAVDVVVLGPEEALDPPEDVIGAVDVVWASRLHPFGLPFGPPPGYPVEDLTLALRQQPDAPPPDIGDASEPAVVTDRTASTSAELGTRANELAAGLGPTDRVLSVLPWTTPDGWVAGVVLPTTASRSVVLARGLDASDAAALAHLCATERVAATAGVDVPGVPRIC